MIDTPLIQQVMASVRQRSPGSALLLTGAGDAPRKALEAAVPHLVVGVVNGAEPGSAADPMVSPVALPYAACSFEFALAWHVGRHDPRLSPWLSEIRRVLSPTGVVVVVEVVVPGSRLRGKAARSQRAAGDYIDALARLRDGAGGRHVAPNDWHSAFAEAGFGPTTEAVCDMRLDASAWSASQRNSAADWQRIRAMILQAPEAAGVYLQPLVSGDRLTFQLKLGVFSAGLAAGATAAEATRRV